jgi:hypothetical protein
VLCDEMEGDEKLGKLERVSLDSRHATWDWKRARWGSGAGGDGGFLLTPELSEEGYLVSIEAPAKVVWILYQSTYCDFLQ